MVTMEKASLWTDSRYWTQAERQMDCNWELHKEGENQVMGSLTHHFKTSRFLSVNKVSWGHR